MGPQAPTCGGPGARPGPRALRPPSASRSPPFPPPNPARPPPAPLFACGPPARAPRPTRGCAERKPRAPHTARRYAGGSRGALCLMRGPGQPGLALSLGIAVTVMWVAYGRLVKQPGSGASVRGAPHLYSAPGYDGVPRRLTALFRSRGRAGAFTQDPVYRPALCRARTGRALLTHVPGRRDGGAPQPA